MSDAGAPPATDAPPAEAPADAPRNDDAPARRSRSRSPRRSRSRSPRRSRSRSRSGGRGGSPGRGGADGKLSGTACRWNARGFGFITPAPGNGNEDLFCHFSSILDGNCLGVRVCGGGRGGCEGISV
jgi:hypothetical protein